MKLNKINLNKSLKSIYTQSIDVSGVGNLFDDSKLVDDYFLKGGYKVVSDIDCRNNISCEYRKLGMQVMVVGPDASFKKYVLKGNDPCSNEAWEELTNPTDEVGVKLVDDYSVLGDSLNTQRDLNLKLKQLILNLQTQIDLTELSDEKVQITEDTSFANIGQSQKDFNKNASDYKINSDLKNQEQDDRLTEIEGEIIAQSDLIHDLNTVLDSERARNDAQDSRLENIEGINYIWSPTNRTLTLFDNNGNQLSQVSLVSLDNEGTYLKYNASTLSLELYNGDNELLDSIPISSFIGSVGTQLQLNSNELQLKDTQGNILSTVTLQIDSKTTDNVVATTTVGAINAGETVPAGTTIQELTELLFDKTFYPTYTPHSFSLTNNAGLREVGSSFNITLTFNFDKGKILGKLDNNIWNPTMLQDYRAGIATSYLLNGVSGSNNSSSFNVTTILGTNPLTGSVTYAIGAQPKDSKGNNYDSPLSSGTSPSQSTTFKGIYPYFYYKSTSPITPAIMQSAIANGQATKVIEDSTGTITIDFDANGEYIAVAYPATSTTKAIWYVNALDNGEIPGGVLGSETTLPCSSPTNLWSNVNFKIHVSAGLITQPNPIQLKNS